MVQFVDVLLPSFFIPGNIEPKVDIPIFVQCGSCPVFTCCWFDLDCLCGSMFGRSMFRHFMNTSLLVIITPPITRVFVANAVSSCCLARLESRPKVGHGSADSDYTTLGGLGN